MAKKKKRAEKITIVRYFDKNVERPPRCLGENEAICDPALCGERWYEECQKQKKK